MSIFAVKWRHAGACVFASGFFTLTHAASAAEVAAVDIAKLGDLSIEELANIKVTSVSKRTETLAATASAIYVITHDEVMRSGAKSLPEILRLAPNLQVYQTSASRYVVTARGMNGAQGAQNFSNKLLVLIDGRSVYTPLFSGVFWDMQDVMPEDIERIEVISGPGAALWGANAVNGVINITTRAASETQGGLVSGWLGDRERGVGVRYGGRLGEAVAYRVYARTTSINDTRLAGGDPAYDHLSRPQAGFRLDWTPGERDTLTLQGDAYDGFEAQPGVAAQDISGANLLGRWTRSWTGGASLQVQAYYDRARRGDELNGVGFRVDTYDIDVQHSFPVGGRQQVVVGGGYRINRIRVDNTTSLLFLPAERDLRLFNVFAQDSIALRDDLTLTLGAKYEDDPYVKAELLPNLRLAWTPREGVTVWAAASKAIRSATPFDRDVVERPGGGSTFLIGGGDFQSEKLSAYELGAKLQTDPRWSLSINTFINHYDELRTIELTPVTVLPLRWGNNLKGYTYGIEAWGDLQAASWWRLSGGVTYLDEKFRFKPGASRLLGPQQVANDPKFDAQLKSTMRFGTRVTLESDLRYVSALPAPRIPGYLDLNGRLAWSLNDRLQLALTGRNLLHPDHLEYTQGNRIPRTVSVDLLWGF